MGENKGSPEIRYPNGQAARLNHISKRVLRSLIVCGVMFIIVLGTQIYSSSIASEEVETVKALNQYRLGSKALTYAVQAYAVTGDKTYYDAYMNELEVDKNRDKALEILKGNDISSDEWAGMDKIAELSNGLVPLEESAMESVENGDMDAAINYVFGEEYANTINEINTTTTTTIETVINRMEKKSKTVDIIGYIMFALFFVAIGWIVLLLRQTISYSKKELIDPIEKVAQQMETMANGQLHAPFEMEPDESEVGSMVASIQSMKESISGIINEISTILKQMGEGNYNIKITQEYVGDYELIRDSFVAIGNTMKETITTIRDVSQQVDSGSGQLAMAAEDLATGSTTQAGKVSDLAEKLSIFFENTKNNAREAAEARELSISAAKKMYDGNEKMQELKVAIKEISNCSSQISSINESIEAIAAQTNLLSLNASIEAARAGEAGKGFAVVADSIKGLSENTTKELEGIKSIITSLVTGFDKCATCIDLVVNSNETNINDTNEVIAAFSLIEAGISETNEKVEKIASVISNAIDEINFVSTQVEDVEGSAESTAAVSEQVTASTEELAALMNSVEVDISELASSSHELEKKINRFTV